MASTTITTVILLFSFHLFTAKGFEAPGQLRKLISRNRHEDQPKELLQSKTNENMDDMDARIEKLKEDMKEIKDMLRQTIQIENEESFQSYRGYETTGTPEPERLLSTVTVSERGDGTNSDITNVIEKQIENSESKVDEIKAVVKKTLQTVTENFSKNRGENDTAEPPEPEEQSSIVAGVGTKTKSDTKNLFENIEDLLSKEIEKIEIKFDEKIKAVQQTMQSFQKLPGEDKTTETPEPEKQPPTVNGDGTNSDTENSLKNIKDQLIKKFEKFETQFDEKLKAVQQTMHSFQKLPGEIETTETPEPEKQPSTMTGGGTNSDTENSLKNIEDLLGKKSDKIEIKFDEKLKAVHQTMQSSQKLSGEETTEIPEPEKQLPTVTGGGTNSDAENSLKNIENLHSKTFEKAETKFGKKIKAVQQTMQDIQKLPGEDETTETPDPEKQLPTVTEGYDAPTDLVYNPTSWNFDSGRLSWKGNRSHVPITKFKGYQVLSCTIHTLKFNKTCPDKEFKPYRIVQNESIELKNLTKGRQYIFAVRFNMINGCYGKMGKLPVFTVPDEDNMNGNGPPETDPLSKTSIIAIAALMVALVTAFAATLAFFIVGHKGNQRSSRAFVSSHYDSRSGTAAFTSTDELGEDEESPMIGRFSDEKPLVIA